jgi:hypothetical protein
MSAIRTRELRYKIPSCVNWFKYDLFSEYETDFRLWLEQVERTIRVMEITDQWFQKRRFRNPFAFPVPMAIIPMTVEP